MEAFFAWTEHVFIHLAILQGRTTSAQRVAEMAEADWGTKFTSVFDIKDTTTKGHFDRLVALRNDVRNYVAHGAFGKQGEAFYFHSAAGAVPVLLPHKAGTRKYRIGSGLRFDASAAFGAMYTFEQFLWDAPRTPARIYIQDSCLPVVLTYARDGTYERGMQSVEDMNECVRILTDIADRAADMDW